MKIVSAKNSLFAARIIVKESRAAELRALRIRQIEVIYREEAWRKANSPTRFSGT